MRQLVYLDEELCSRPSAVRNKAVEGEKRGSRGVFFVFVLFFSLFPFPRSRRHGERERAPHWPLSFFLLPLFSLSPPSFSHLERERHGLGVDRQRRLGDRARRGLPLGRGSGRQGRRGSIDGVRRGSCDAARRMRGVAPGDLFLREGVVVFFVVEREGIVSSGVVAEEEAAERRRRERGGLGASKESFFFFLSTRAKRGGPRPKALSLAPSFRFLFAPSPLPN
jgi:hypothetical protein